MAVCIWLLAEEEGEGKIFAPCDDLTTPYQDQTAFINAHTHIHTWSALSVRLAAAEAAAAVQSSMSIIERSVAVFFNHSHAHIQIFFTFNTLHCTALRVCACTIYGIYLFTHLLIVFFFVRLFVASCDLLIFVVYMHISMHWQQRARHSNQSNYGFFSVMFLFHMIWPVGVCTRARLRSRTLFLIQYDISLLWSSSASAAAASPFPYPTSECYANHSNDVK